MTGRLAGLAARLRPSPRDERAWREARFVVLDFETTGLDLRRAAPLSVGWVVVRDGRVVLAEAGYTRIRHRGGIPADALAVHRLLPADVADAPAAGVVAQRLRPVLDGAVLVAHGAWTERAMLRRLDLGGRLVDTLQLARALDRLDGHESARATSLAAVAGRLGVPVHRVHHAFSDALTAGGLLLALLHRLERHGAGDVDTLRRLGRVR